LVLAAACAALGLSAYGATAQDMKAAKPAPKPPACTKIKKEDDCKKRDDCEWVVKGKKGSCKAKPKPKAPPKGK
jgi:hypothetical protein